MSTVMNIAGAVPIDDPEYRYKMPRLITKIEGRGNGIKTVVMNCVELSLALHRSAGEITKFFGCELGAQSKYDEKTEKSVINGAFETTLMQTHLSKYIESFVLCPSCRLPETKYKVKTSNQIILHKCYACGATDPVDMNHKLTTFILKEYAAAKRASKKKDSAKKDKKSKEKKDKDKDKDSMESNDNNDSDNSNDTNNEKKSKVKKTKSTSSSNDKHEKSKEKSEKSNKKSKKSKKSENSKDDEVEWHTDLSAEAVAARAAEAELIETAAINAISSTDSTDVNVPEQLLNNLTIKNSKDNDEIKQCSLKLRKYMKNNKNKDKILNEIRSLQETTSLNENKRLHIFVNTIFDKDILTSNKIPFYSSILKEIINNSKNNEMQLELISLCSFFCGVEYPELLTGFPIILKLFYDEELLEEEYLLNWYQNKELDLNVSKEIRSKLCESLKPFIEWLQNAEEESDDEEKDEDDD